MDDWLTGRIEHKHSWTERLFTLRAQVDGLHYKPGQFVRISLMVGDERVARPYSCVNPPSEPGLEIYYNTVEHGPLTTALLSADAGDTLWIARQPNGFFTLDEVPDAAHLWLLATGTGLGVFLCLLQTETIWRRFAQVRLVHAVRTVAELSYRERIEAIRQAHPEHFAYIPMVSREHCAFAMAGRIPEAIEKGTLEHRAALPIDPADTQVMLCGNQGMLRDATTVLTARGLRRNRRRDPGQITTEKYW